MAASFVVHNANGVSGDFAIPFGYFTAAHLEARVNNIIVGFTLISQSVIRISPVPAATSRVSIRRRTPAEYTVPAKDLPLLVRYFAEEAMDLTYNFDAIYGSIFYDVAFTVQDGESASPTIADVNPDLFLRPTAITATLTAPLAAGPLVFTLQAVDNAGLTTDLGTASFATGQKKATVEMLSLASFPAGTTYRLVETTAAVFTTATVVARFARL